MEKTLKLPLKYLFLFLVGGLIYCGVEIGFRGRTHWSMGIVGGICFILCGGLNDWLPWEMPLWRQMLIGAINITAVEFLSGLILNVWLGLAVWDYSSMPLNIMGQICLPFSIAWFFISGCAIILDDYLRYWFFGEEKPHYVFFKKVGDD